MIPDEGRDVQCSNCGNTWFELPAPAAEPSEAAAPPDSAPVDEVEDTGDLADDAADTPEDTAPAAAAETARKDSSLHWPDEDDDLDVWREAAVSNQTPKRPKDLAAVDVLKEEAEREIEQRRSNTQSTLETQSEFGLDAAPRTRETPSRALQARMARMKSEDTGPTDAPAEADYAAPRRDLLPDIEEINSSLGPAGTKVTRSPAQQARHRSGFRLGFVLTAGVALVAILAYAWAPAIAEAIPGSETALLNYVDWANGARDALDGLIGRVGG